MPQKIWESEDDKGKYTARCVRIGPTKGKLLLIKKGPFRVFEKILREQEVPLAYGAIYGPDIDDVREWNRICTAWSEELDRQEKP